MFINCRTTHDKKIPSFGSSSESQTEPELDGASSSASEATLRDKTVKDHENQTDNTARRVKSDLCGGDQQESVSEEISDQMESEDIKPGQTVEGVSQETALVENVMAAEGVSRETAPVENVMEEDTSCQVSGLSSAIS